MKETWQALLTQLEIIDNSEESEISSEEEILSFERETGIILPTSYKEFCQVFGTGRFGDFITIYCPSRRLSFISDITVKSILSQMGLFDWEFESDEYYYDDLNEESGTDSDLNSIKNLLDSALIFGDDSGAYVALWDLKTYSASDQSYDIYWVSMGCCSSDDLYLIGRDFFEFVYGFCLEMKSYEILPESARPLPQLLSYTFTRFRTPEGF